MNLPFGWTLCVWQMIVVLGGLGVMAESLGKQSPQLLGSKNAHMVRIVPSAMSECGSCAGMTPGANTSTRLASGVIAASIQREVTTI